QPKIYFVIRMILSVLVIYAQRTAQPRRAEDVQHAAIHTPGVGWRVWLARSIFIFAIKLSVAQKLSKPCFEIIRKLANAWWTRFVGVIVNRILALLQALRNVP